MPTNTFTGTLRVALDFTNAQIKVLVEDGYDTQESVLYWKFKSIKEWCQLKCKIHVIRCGISFVDRKIKCLQALVWWVLDLTLRGKTVDLNYFNSDVLYDSIEESRLGFEDNRDGKGGLSNPKGFFIKNELNGRA